jgi:fructose-1,6-bisphosphatase/inositol monophosphatase family enzyme
MAIAAARAPSTSEFFNAAVAALISVRKQVRDKLLIQPERALRKHTVPSRMVGGKPKEVLAVDTEAEDLCDLFLRAPSLGLSDHLLVLGEETLWDLPDLDLSKQHVEMEGSNRKPRVVDGPETKVVAILDMIDGSDLLERGLGNWCSAIVFFDPTTHPPKILFSLVHDADDSVIYGADELEAFRIKVGKRGKLDRRPLRSPKAVIFSDASICFYAQKTNPFNTIPEGFYKWLASNIAVEPNVDRLRIYTLAGNPMMCKLGDGEDIHTVFEHRGQFPHDAVPGVYIARRAGASLLDLEGNEITEQRLANSLLTPSVGKLKYVLASTHELATEIGAALKS